MTEIEYRWGQIAARVDSFARSAAIFLQAQGIQSEDPHGIAFKVFNREATRLLGEIRQFRDNHAQLLPAAATGELDDFLGSAGLSQILLANGVQGLDVVKAFPPILLSVCASVSYLLADRNATGARLTERALGHLQRSLAVLDSEGAVWQAAFASGEVECEKLGGLHLLRFGVFAFKADPGGARTDLVLGDVITTTSPLAAASDALVLTEWKVVREKDEPTDVAALARRQLELYTAGPLLGIELRSIRYAILVSEAQIAVPSDVTADEVVYRHINIAVKPHTPSKAAKRLSAGNGS